MANILSASEAATVLRCASDDPIMLAMLSGVDAYIRRATGRDWTADAAICEEAKSCARMLLVQWHENPGMTGSEGSLSFGLAACLTQLQAMALEYIEFYGRDGAGAVLLPGAHKGDTVSSVTGLIGATGDQSASFEAVITVSGQIQQVSTSDLSDKVYRVKLTPPGEL